MFDPVILQDVKEVSEQDLPVLAGVQAWNDCLMLEDPEILITFQEMDVETEIIRKLLGSEVWLQFFGEAGVKAEDTVPFQIRQLVTYQLNLINARLQEQGYEEARNKAKSAAETRRLAIRQASAEFHAAAKRARVYEDL